MILHLPSKKTRDAIQFIYQSNFTLNDKIQKQEKKIQNLTKNLSNKIQIFQDKAKEPNFNLLEQLLELFENIKTHINNNFIVEQQKKSTSCFNDESTSESSATNDKAKNLNQNQQDIDQNSQSQQEQKLLDQKDLQQKIQSLLIIERDDKDLKKNSKYQIASRIIQPYYLYSQTDIVFILNYLIKFSNLQHTRIYHPSFAKDRKVLKYFLNLFIQNNNQLQCIFPLHLSVNHWVAAFVIKQEHKIILNYWDPSVNQIDNFFLSALLQVIEEHQLQPEFRLIKISIQKSDSLQEWAILNQHCGPYVVFLIKEYLINHLWLYEGKVIYDGIGQGVLAFEINRDLDLHQSQNLGITTRLNQSLLLLDLQQFEELDFHQIFYFDISAPYDQKTKCPYARLQLQRKVYQKCQLINSIIKQYPKKAKLRFNESIKENLKLLQKWNKSPDIEQAHQSFLLKYSQGQTCQIKQELFLTKRMRNYYEKFKKSLR